MMRREATAAGCVSFDERVEAAARGVSAWLVDDWFWDTLDGPERDDQREECQTALVAAGVRELERSDVALRQLVVAVDGLRDVEFAGVGFAWGAVHDAMEVARAAIRGSGGVDDVVVR